MGERAHNFYDRTHTLPSGEPILQTVPGDVYFAHVHEPNEACTWSNCDGRHLICVLPPSGEPWSDGTEYLHEWNVDGRASNCTIAADTTHRCWIRHGDPSRGELTVDKNGHTCAAGAGSILVGSYHGFLRGFALVRS